MGTEMPPTSRPKPRWWMDAIDAVFLVACVWQELNTFERPGPRNTRLMFIVLYAVLAIVFSARIWNRRFGGAGPRD
jgi:hypothetical protein